MTDEQLLEEYTKEIQGEYYYNDNITVVRLIESHRHLRQKNIEWNGAFDEARAQGYKCGYDFGVKQAASDTIQYKDLRKMTIQDLANLIGTDDD